VLLRSGTLALFVVGLRDRRVNKIIVHYSATLFSRRPGRRLKDLLQSRRRSNYSMRRCDIRKYRSVKSPKTTRRKLLNLTSNQVQPRSKKIRIKTLVGTPSSHSTMYPILPCWSLSFGMSRTSLRKTSRTESQLRKLNAAIATWKRPRKQWVTPLAIHKSARVSFEFPTCCILKTEQSS